MRKNIQVLIFGLLAGFCTGCTFDSAGLPENQIIKPPAPTAHAMETKATPTAAVPNARPAAMAKVALKTAIAHRKFAPKIKFAFHPHRARMESATGTKPTPTAADRHATHAQWKCSAGKTATAPLNSAMRPDFAPNHPVRTEKKAGTKLTPTVADPTVAPAPAAARAWKIPTASAECARKLFAVCLPDNDRVLNGSETDTDCGGPDCGPCANAKIA
jgi:hypothetical protein